MAEEYIHYSAKAPIKGIDTSVPEDEMSPLNYPDGINVDTTDGKLVKAKGYTQLLAGFPDAQPVMEGVEYGDTSGVLHLAFCTQDKLIEYNSGDTWSDRSAAIAMTGDEDDAVFMVNVAGLSTDRLVITNGVDVMKTWTGSGNWTNLTTTGFTTLLGKCAAGFKGHLVIGDTSEDGTLKPYRIRWSNNSDATIWNGVTAGFLNLVEDNENSRVMTLLALRQALIAYKYGSIVNLTYKAGVGGIYFSANQVIANSGAISRKGVCPVGDLDLHLMVTEDNIHIFDGFDFQRVSGNKYLGDRIKSSFFSELNWAKRGLIFCKAFPEQYKVVIIYPTGSSTVCDKARIWDWKEDAWHTRDFTNDGYSLISVGQFFSARKALYGINSNIMTLFSGNTDNGTAIDANFRTKLHDFSDLDRQLGKLKKTTERVELESKGTDPQVEIASTNNITTTPSFTTGTVVADDPSGLKINTSESIRATGRYMSLKVRDNSTTAPFEVAKYSIFFRPRGVR